MKMIKFPALLIATVLVLSFCFVSAAASTATGEVAVTFNPPSSSSSTSSSTSSGGGGGGGTTVPDRDRPTTGGGGETVVIVDPEVPLAEFLDDLPQTGGNTALPCILIMAGALCLFAAKRDNNARYCPCKG